MPLRAEPAGSIWRRIYAAVHANPLGHGPGLSRFSDPTGARFGVIYFGSSIKVAFAEVVLRDRGDSRLEPPIVPFAELRTYACADIELVADLQLVDLTGDGCLRLGVPGDVVGARDQTLARLWSQAFFDHPAAPDGVLYPSRLNEKRNIALYARAIDKVTAKRVTRLIDRRPQLARIIRDFDIAVV